jgi:hypothetical protein
MYLEICIFIYINICVHKGGFPTATATTIPTITDKSPTRSPTDQPATQISTAVPVRSAIIGMFMIFD